MMILDSWGEISMNGATTAGSGCNRFSRFDSSSLHRMIISRDKLYIDGEIPKGLFDVLKYKNPEYYQKRNMGISVFRVAKEIRTYRVIDGRVEILRGEIEKVQPFFPKDLPIPQHPETEPTGYQYANPDFELDEHQEGAVRSIKEKNQGIIHAVTSAGKTLIILKAICELGVPALIIVHRKILMQQFLEDIEKYIRDENGEKIVPGIIGDGKARLGRITIAIDKTLVKYLPQIDHTFGAVFLDECHLAPAATMLTIVNVVNSKHRYGFSGTLRRKDQKEFLMYATFGSVIHTIGKEVLLELGRVVPVEIKVVESETRFDYAGASEALGATKAFQLMEKTLATDPGRRELIVDLVAKLPGKTIILSRLVEPCYKLSTMLQERHKLESGIITGRDSKEALASYQGMKKADLKTIFATVGCVSTGVSISDLDNIVLIAPIYTNELLLHQIRGRLMRTAEGKEKGTLYFIFDPYVFAQGKLNKFLQIMKS